jgi:DinB superfamily
MIGRPQPAETAPYYFVYIDQFAGEDPLATLQAQLAGALAFFAGISEEKSRHRYAPEKWSIRQVVNHISDTERTFAFRAWWFARGFDSALPSYDQNIAAGAAGADKVWFAHHVEEFRRVRLSTISLYQNMPAEAWNRSGIASEKPFTVRALAFIIGGHVEHHLKILRDRYF